MNHRQFLFAPDALDLLAFHERDTIKARKPDGEQIRVHRKIRSDGKNGQSRWSGRPKGQRSATEQRQRQ